MDNSYVLAMYDIRGKQEFIYRSSRIKEIVGGSLLIADLFRKYLFPAALEVRKKEGAFPEKGPALYASSVRENGEPEDFSPEAFEERMRSGRYIGEIIYDGGGNFLVLYRDRETAIAVNRGFTRRILQEIGTLKVVCSMIEGVDFQDYKGDERKLRRLHMQRESIETPRPLAQTLPVTQVDYRTSMPLVTMQRNEAAGTWDKVTRETAAKLDACREAARSGRDGEFDEDILDNMVTEKGKESLLAIIYIDGNNIGARVMECLEGKKTYTECIGALRRLSARIQKDFVDDRIPVINEVLRKKYPDTNDPEETEKNRIRRRRRIVLGAGDEINLICNARDAYEIAAAYLRTLPKGCSSCAGIAVFHSHAPYADAYRIAEECCGSGKKRIRQIEADPVLSAEATEDMCLIDFHFCQGGIGVSLDKIRDHESKDLISRPWLLDDDRPFLCGVLTTKGVADMAAALPFARTNIKGFSDSAGQSLAALTFDLKRVCAHSKRKMPDLTLGGALRDPEMARRLIFDISIMYDLWFEKADRGGTKDE